MGRTVDTTLQNYLDAPSCETQTCLIVELVTGEVINITTSRKTLFVTITGDEFAPNLRKVGEINQSAFANVDRCQVTAQNVDKVLGSRILAGDLSKARCAVARVYQDDYDKTATQSFVELFSGEFKSLEVLPEIVNFEIVDDLVAAGYSVADWSLADDCPFVYKDPLTCTCDSSSPGCNKLRMSDGGCSGKVRTDGKDQTAWFGGMEAAEESNESLPTGGGIGGEAIGNGDLPCFIGETSVLMANGIMQRFDYLFEKRADFIGRSVRCFDPENNLQTGRILQVFRSTVDELLEVGFKNEPAPMLMNKLHKFWTKNKEFVPMYLLSEGDKVFALAGDALNLIEIESMRIIPQPEGSFVYNLHVSDYHDYFAAAANCKPKAVSNSKDIPLGGA